MRSPFGEFLRGSTMRWESIARPPSPFMVDGNLLLNKICVNGSIHNFPRELNRFIPIINAVSLHSSLKIGLKRFDSGVHVRSAITRTKWSRPHLGSRRPGSHAKTIVIQVTI